jgi:hypothetical protein
VISLVLASADYFVPVPAAQPAAVDYYQASDPAALPFLARADVVMNTKYSERVFDAIGFKKNAKSGRTKSLYGYTTGSRAPKGSIRSGTVNEYGYGFDNLYGGRQKRAASQSNEKVEEQRARSNAFLGLLAICAVIVLAKSAGQ